MQDKTPTKTPLDFTHQISLVIENNKNEKLKLTTRSRENEVTGAGSVGGSGSGVSLENWVTNNDDRPMPGGLGFSEKAINCINHFLNDMLEWVVEQSSNIAATLSSYDQVTCTHVGTAVKPVFEMISSMKEDKEWLENCHFKFAQREPTAMISHHFSIIDSCVAILLDENNNNNNDKDSKESSNRKSQDDIQDGPKKGMQVGKGGWQEVMVKDDIIVERKLDAVCIVARSRCEIGASPIVIKDTILDVTKMMKWSPFCKSAKVVRILDRQTDIRHLAFQARWQCLKINSRDFSVAYHWFRTKDDSYVIAIHSVVDEACPLVPGMIRADCLPTGFIISPLGNGSRSMVRFICHVDLKEAPKELFSILAERIPYDLIHLRIFLTGKKTL